MRRILSCTLFVIVLLLLVASLAFFGFSIYAIADTLTALAGDSSASGIDYLGLGWICGILLLSASSLGLALSGISIHLQRQKPGKILSISATVLFSLLFAASFFLLFL